MLPDVCCDFSKVKMEEVELEGGERGVLVRGASGKPPTDTYKVGEHAVSEWVYECMQLVSGCMSVLMMQLVSGCMSVFMMQLVSGCMSVLMMQLVSGCMSVFMMQLVSGCMSVFMMH